MPPKTRPRLIAITGNIAAGKSEVCKWFRERGYKVYLTDKIAHECLQKDFTKKQLYYRFGKDIFTEKNQIDRAKLGEIVFADKNKLQLLNSIVHPLVRQEMQQIIDNAEDEILIFEIPLLFESGLERAFDFSINVSVKKQKQKERLAQRDEIASQQQEQRINSQMSNEKKNQKADFVIDNNGSREKLVGQLERLELLLKDIPRKPVDRLTDI